MRLGGIDVPHDRSLIGHSDADVLLHAVTDALLGAAALPDIGQLFPNTDEANRDRDSAEMLTAAKVKVADAGYTVVNLDCVITAERPKLADYKDAICHRIASILQVNSNQVGLLVKPGEQVGAVGREERDEGDRGRSAEGVQKHAHRLRAPRLLVDASTTFNRIPPETELAAKRVTKLLVFRIPTR